jgi:hypothetical protein
MERLRMKNLLLACAVMLGIQFCCPLVLRAGDHAQMAELISLGVKDAECEVEADDVLHLEMALTALFCRAHVVDSRVDLLVEPTRVSDPLLPTAGLFPSAP